VTEERGQFVVSEVERRVESAIEARSVVVPVRVTVCEEVEEVILVEQSTAAETSIVNTSDVLV
jgi:hypothetical protein